MISWPSVSRWISRNLLDHSRVSDRERKVASNGERPMEALRRRKQPKQSDLLNVTGGSVT